MHQDHRQAGLGGDAHRIGVVRERGDVVEDVGAGGGGLAHHLGLARVDGDQHIGARPQALDDWDDARELLLGGDVVGAGAGRFAADVENVGALLGELQSVRDGGLRRRVQAAVGEAVGRNVDDAHDARTVERQTGKARARRGDCLEVLRGGEGAAAPVALDGIAERDDAAPDASAIALGDLDRGKAQRLTGERQAAPGVFFSLGGRRKEADGPHVDGALHACRDPKTKRPRGSSRGRIYSVCSPPVKGCAIRTRSRLRLRLHGAGSDGNARRRSARPSRSGLSERRRRACARSSRRATGYSPLRRRWSRTPSAPA